MTLLKLASLSTLLLSGFLFAQEKVSDLSSENIFKTLIKTLNDVEQPEQTRSNLELINKILKNTEFIQFRDGTSIDLNSIRDQEQIKDTFLQFKMDIDEPLRRDGGTGAGG